MTCSMVTGAWGNAGKHGREDERWGVEELVSPDGELSKIDDFISPALPSVLPRCPCSLMPSLVAERLTKI